MDLKDGAKQRLKHRAGLVCSRKSKAILEQKSNKKQDGASLVAQLVKNLPRSSPSGEASCQGPFWR